MNDTPYLATGAQLKFAPNSTGTPIHIWNHRAIMSFRPDPKELAAWHSARAVEADRKEAMKPSNIKKRKAAEKLNSGWI
jgi:hypothetical protein